MADSTCSRVREVERKSSWRAPALSAIAFQPFCVGTVTRTLTLPRRRAPGGSRRESRSGSRGSPPAVPPESAHAVDDAVLDLQPVLGGAQAHLAASPRRRAAGRSGTASPRAVRCRLRVCASTRSSWSSRPPTGITRIPGSPSCSSRGAGHVRRAGRHRDGVVRRVLGDSPNRRRHRPPARCARVPARSDCRAPAPPVRG